MGEQGRVKAVASPMRVRDTSGLRSPSAVLSPPSSPSKKDMARLAEQKAMEWASGISPNGEQGGLTPSSRSSRRSPAKRTPKSPLVSTRGCLLGAGPTLPSTPELKPASKEPASAVESQLDDILKELDEIDRIHDDVCMLAHC